MQINLKFKNDIYKAKFYYQSKTTESPNKSKNERLVTELNNYSSLNDPSLKSTLGSIDFTSKLYAWQREYSAGEAVEQAYADATAPSLLGNDKPFAGMCKQEYILYRKNLGMDYSIDWTQLKRDLNTTGSNYESSNDALDYFAARYAVLKDRITSEPNTSNQLSKLDEYFTSSIKNLANKMTSDLNTRLLDFGICCEKQTINKSLLAAFDKKSSYYFEFIKNTSDYAGIEGTDFEWLASDDRFMAASLRKASNSDKCEYEPQKRTSRIFSKQYDNSALYTQKELSSLNLIMESMENSLNIQNISSSSSEEEVGFFLGSRALEIGIASKFAKFGEKMTNLTDRLFNSYLNCFVDFCNENIERTRHDNQVAVTHPNEAYYDKDTIIHIANLMNNSIKNGNSIENSLKIGYKEACSSYLERQKQYSSELRYCTKEN